MNESPKPNKFLHPILGGLPGLLSGLLLIWAGPISAQIYNFTDTATGSFDWSTGEGWNATPTSSDNTVLNFFPSVTLPVSGSTRTLNNDFAGPFVLNQLNLQGTAANNTNPGSNVTVNLAGGTLSFLANGITAPAINLDANRSTATSPTRSFEIYYNIENAIEFDQALIISSNGSGNFAFNGTINGAGELTFNGRNGTTDFNGGIIASAFTFNGRSGITNFNGGITTTSAFVFNNQAASNATVAAIGGSGKMQFNIEGSTTISGPITRHGDLLKTGQGLLILQGSHTGAGATLIEEGTLRVSASDALSSGNLTLNGGVLDLNHATDFTRSLGTGAGEVQFTGDGGFSATGAARTVNLGGAGAMVTWGSGGFVGDGYRLLLSSADANNSVYFMNGIDLGTANRTIYVENGSAAEDARLAGVISGTGGLIKTGQGTLALTAINTFTGNLAVQAGTVSVGLTGSIAADEVVLGGMQTGNSAATLSVTGAGSVTPTTLNGVTFKAGRSQIAATRSGGSGNFILEVGALNREAGALAIFTPNANTQIQTTTGNGGGGILGAWATVGSDWATVDDSNNIVAYSDYTAPGGTASNPVINDGAATNVQITAGGSFTKSGVTVDYNSTLVTGVDTTGLQVGDSVNGGWPATSGSGQMRIVGGTYITAIDSVNGTITLSQPVGRYWSGSNNGTQAANVTLTFNHQITLQNSGLTEVNTIQSTDSSNRVIDIGAGNTLRLGASGGIWKTSTAAGVDTMGSSIILNGGTLTAGGADNTDGEIILNAAGANDEFSGGNASRANTGIVINSTITDNGTGVVSLIKTGVQRANLNVNNSYTGDTYVLQGILFAGANQAFGTGTVHVNGGGLGQGSVLFGSSMSIANDFRLSGGDGLVLQSGASTVFTGDITLLSNGRILTSSSGNISNAVIFQGEISGDFELALDGGSAVRLQHSNLNWTGDTRIIGTGTSSSLTSRIRLEADQAIGSGNLRMELPSNNNPSAVLDLYGFSQTIDALISSGGGVDQKFIVQSTTGTGNLTVGAGNGSGIYTGAIGSGGTSLNLTKSGTGTQELLGVNSYTGTTIVNGGTLLISGAGTLTATSGVTANNTGTFAYTAATALNRNVTANSGGTFRYSSAANYSGTFTFNDGARLAGTNWNGSLDNQTISNGKIIAPGNSPGAAFSANQTWGDGGIFEFEINDADGDLATNWDHLSLSGALDLSTITTGVFTIKLISLTSLNTAGLLANFDPGATYSWEFASFASLPAPFLTSQFTVDTTGFANSFSGTFSVAQLGNTLVLNYAAIPEPSTVALLGLAAIGGYLVRRRSSAR